MSAVTDSIREQATRWFISRGASITLGEALAYIAQVKADCVDTVIAAWKDEMVKSGSYRQAAVCLVISLIESMHARGAARPAAEANS